MKKNKANGMIIGFLKSSIIFFLGSFLSKIVSFLLLPLYTSYLSPEQYGIYNVNNTYVLLLIFALFFEIWTPIMRWMFQCKTDDEKRQVISSGGIAYALSLGLYLVFSTIVFTLLEVEYIPLVVLYGVFYTLSSFISFSVRGFEKNIDYAISGVINTLVSALSNIILITQFNLDYSSLYIAFIIGATAQIGYLEVRVGVLRGISIKNAKKAMAKEMFLFAVPLAVNSLCYWGFNSFTTIVIDIVMTKADNGLYSVATRFSTLMSFVVTAVSYAWQQMSYRHEEEKRSDSTFYNKAVNMFLISICCGVVLLLPAIRVVFPIMIGMSFSEAIQYVPLSIMMTAVNSFTALVGSIFAAIKNTKPVFWASLSACLVNLAISFPLVRQFGLNGASLSMLLSYIVSACTMLVVLNRILGIRIRMVILLFGGCAAIISSLIFVKGSIVSNILWLLFVGVSLLLVLISRIKKYRLNNLG